MYSSCSCSKFRSLLPAPMDCMVGDDRPVRLYTSAEYGIGDRRPFYLGFTSVLHGRWSPFSSRFKFQQAETVGRYDCYLRYTSVCVYHIEAVTFTFDGLMVLLIKVLKYFVLTGRFILSVFFLPFRFRLNLKCFIYVVTASTSAASSFTQQASLHSTKDYHENNST